MKTIEAKEIFHKWLQELCRWGKVDQFIHWKEEVYNSNKYLGICYLYTHTYHYQIKAHFTTDSPKTNSNYLGCQVSTRMPRAGEDWTRGNDLPDGKLTRETWESIKNAILKYELVKVAKPVKHIADEKGV